MNNFNFPKECLHIQLSPSADMELEKILDKNYCLNWRTRQNCADWHSHLSQDLFNLAKSGYKEPPLRLVDNINYADLPLSYGNVGYCVYMIIRKNTPKLELTTKYPLWIKSGKFLNNIH